METFRPIFPRRGKKFSTPWKTAWAAALAWAVAAGGAWAASPFSARAERAEYDGRPALRVSFAVPPGHNLYDNFAAAEASGAALERLFAPEPDVRKPDDPEPSHSASFAAYFELPSSETVVVSFQGCMGGMCFMPEEVELPLAAAAVPEAASAPTAAEDVAAEPWAELLARRGEPRVRSGSAEVAEFLAFLDPALAESGGGEASAWRQFLDDPAAFYLRFGIWPAILLILAGGFLLNLTPCVLPMIPINLAIIGASSMDVSRRGRFGLGLVYGLGMALTYGALGLAVVLFGAVFGTLQASPIFNGAIALVFLALALAMFDVWQLDLSRFRRGSGGLPGKLRLPAVLAMGGISAVLAGACVAPVLIAVLALSGALYAGEARAVGVLLPFLLGVGMALPWPLAAAGLAVLPKPGAWMEKVKKGFGALILLLAAYYGWQAWRAWRPAAPPAPAAAEGAAGETFRVATIARDDGGFEALVREALASGKPILFNFGATWCVECKIMDAGTLSDPAVAAKLRETFAIKVIADQPRRPPARELLAPFPIPGFPTYVWVPGAE